jgi:cytoskeletal protein CcmA (bactofilin family)
MFNSKKDTSENNLDSESLSSDAFKFGSENLGASDAEGQRVLQEIEQNRSKSVYSMGGGLSSENENELALSSASGNMTVGPGVRMEGAIRHFENLMILGSSEGELEGENLTIGEGGRLKGTATIRNMEVVGHFQGTAEVASHVLLRSTGSVDGTISYTSIEIENGGQISGEMNPTNKGLNGKIMQDSDLEFPKVPFPEMTEPRDAGAESDE